MIKQTWIRGKSQNKQFNEIIIPFKTSILSTLYSIILTLIIVAPIFLVFYQFISVYIYFFIAKTFVLYIGLVLFAVAFMFINALITILSINISKSSLKENIELQEIDTKAIFVYQMFNPLFFAFIVLVLILFGGVI